MKKDDRLYQGLLEAIGNRSLPEGMGQCIGPETLALSNCDRFRAAQPFPHIVLEGFLTPEYCRQLLEEFPPFHPEYAVDENGAIGGKATHTDIQSIGPSYRKLDELIQTRAFLGLMSTITGIPDLLYDPDYLGGGTHENMDGQSLDFHVDFNYHHIHRWHRRINLILFLNEHWEDDWGGNLELREKPGETGDVRVAPLFNRAVIFETNEVSWHGFTSISLPQGSEVSRKSIALYFYTRERPDEEKALPRSTVYVEEFLPDHLVEGYRLEADDIVTLRSLVDRRDSHIARLYQHERDLTAKVFELEGGGRTHLRRLFIRLVYIVAKKTQPFRHWLFGGPLRRHATDYPYIQFSRASARPHLLDGWGEVEASMVWSVGPCSVLELPLLQCSALNLHFECRPFDFPGAPVQTVMVFLNDSAQGSVELSAGKQSYQLPLNESDQCTGSNVLRLEYAFTTSPASVGNPGDDRELAVAWFNLWLSERN